MGRAYPWEDWRGEGRRGKEEERERGGDGVRLLRGGGREGREGRTWSKERKVGRDDFF